VRNGRDDKALDIGMSLLNAPPEEIAFQFAFLDPPVGEKGSKTRIFMRSAFFVSPLWTRQWRRRSDRTQANGSAFVLRRPTPKSDWR